MSNVLHRLVILDSIHPFKGLCQVLKIIINYKCFCYGCSILFSIFLCCFWIWSSGIILVIPWCYPISTINFLYLVCIIRYVVEYLYKEITFIRVISVSFCYILLVWIIVIIVIICYDFLNMIIVVYFVIWVVVSTLDGFLIHSFSRFGIYYILFCFLCYLIGFICRYYLYLYIVI